MDRAPRTAAWVCGGVGLALLARLLHGGGDAGYDALYSLIWGRELIDGALPDVQVEGAPTPHPGGIAMASLAAPFGVDAAREILLAVSYLGLGFAAAAVAVETERLAGALGAICAALLVVLAPPIADLAREAYVDLPFAALVTTAVALVVRNGSAVRLPLSLLAAAGTLRPEAWAFALALVLWRGRDDWLAWALAAAGPVVWGAVDLALTGEVFSSAASTELRGRPTGIADAFQGAPAGARELIGAFAAGAALVGAYAVSVVRPTLANAAIGAPAIALVCFLVFGAAGQPVIQRYTLLLSLLLVPLAATAAFGWTRLDGDHRARRWWAPAGVLLAIGLAAAAIIRLDDPQGLDDRLPEADDLEQLVRSDSLRDAVAGCGVLQVGATEYVPLARWVVDLEADDVVAYDAGAPRAGTLVIPLAERPPAGAAPIEDSRAWSAFALDC